MMVDGGPHAVGCNTRTNYVTVYVYSTKLYTAVLRTTNALDRPAKDPEQKKDHLVFNLKV